jgi:hypothetical protein
VQEQEPVNLSEYVKDVFDEMMVRPEIRQISRIGRKSSGTSTRPIKVKVSSSSTASLILGQARRLRYSEAPRLKSVFVKPDLSIEERNKRRILVQDLNQRRNSEPNKRHKIRGGAVHSEDIKPTK